MCRYLQKSDEDIRSFATGVTGNWILIHCKSRKCSLTTKTSFQCLHPPKSTFAVSKNIRRSVFSAFSVYTVGLLASLLLRYSSPPSSNSFLLWIEYRKRGAVRFHFTSPFLSDICYHSLSCSRHYKISSLACTDVLTNCCVFIHMDGFKLELHYLFYSHLTFLSVFLTYWWIYFFFLNSYINKPFCEVDLLFILLSGSLYIPYINQTTVWL